MDTRTVHWFEGSYDLQKIDANHWQFQIAKVVATSPGSPPMSNMIWKSVALQPQANITWPVEYGLNWSATLPTAGITVTVGGRWQACNKGQAFDLTRLGEWTPSVTAPTPGWMTVGKINYKYPDVPGIHIIVGVKNPATGNFDPIFIDPTELPPGSGGTYQPQELVQWWLEGANLTGSVYNRTHGAVADLDFSKPAPDTNKYEYWTTYLFDSGSWAITQDAPPEKYSAPPPYEPLDSDPNPDGPSTIQLALWPWIGMAALTTAVASVRAATVRAELKVQLEAKYTGVSVEWEGTNNMVLKFSLGRVKNAQLGSVEALGYTADSDPTADVNAALTSVKNHGDFPPGESWTIKSGSGMMPSKGLHKGAAITNGH